MGHVYLKQFVRLSVLLMAVRATFTSQAEASPVVTGFVECRATPVSATSALPAVAPIRVDSGNPMNCSGSPASVTMIDAFASASWDDLGVSVIGHSGSVPVFNSTGGLIGRYIGAGVAQLSWSNRFIATGGTGAAFVRVEIANLEAGLGCRATVDGAGAAFAFDTFAITFGTPFTLDLQAGVAASNGNSQSCSMSLRTSVYSDSTFGSVIAGAQLDPVVVPEPATAMVAGCGIVAILLRHRRRLN